MKLSERVSEPQPACGVFCPRQQWVDEIYRLENALATAKEMANQYATEAGLSRGELALHREVTSELRDCLLEAKASREIPAQVDLACSAGLRALDELQGKRTMAKWKKVDSPAKGK